MTCILPGGALNSRIGNKNLMLTDVIMGDADRIYIPFYRTGLSAGEQNKKYTCREGITMAGRRVIITGVPGVGKTTVVNGALARLKEEGTTYESLNFGSFMFEVAQRDGIVKDRDEMRKLDREGQKRLQQMAAHAMAQVPGNVIIDTHASIKTPTGYLPGLPEWVLRELMPDTIILVETDEDQILMRRLSDETRTRDREGSRAIAEHQQFNRSIAAAYAMITGCTIQIVINADHLLEQATETMAAALR
jgi:adenylate kinase